MKKLVSSSSVLLAKNANTFTKSDIESLLNVRVFKNSLENGVMFSEIFVNFQENNRKTYHGTEIDLITGKISGEKVSSTFKALMDTSEKFAAGKANMAEVVLIKNYLSTNQDINTAKEIQEDGIKLFADKQKDGFCLFYFELVAGYTRYVTTLNASLQEGSKIDLTKLNVPYRVLGLNTSSSEQLARKKAREENLAENIGANRVTAGNTIYEILVSFMKSVFDGLKFDQIKPSEALKIEGFDVSQLVNLAFHATPKLLETIELGYWRKSALNKILNDKRITHKTTDKLLSSVATDENGKKYIVNPIIDAVLEVLQPSKVGENTVFKANDVKDSIDKLIAEGTIKESSTKKSGANKEEKIDLQKIQSEAKQASYLIELSNAGNDVSKIEELADKVAKNSDASKETFDAIEKQLNTAKETIAKRNADKNQKNTGKLVSEFVSRFSGRTPAQIRKEFAVKEDKLPQFMQLTSILELFVEGQPINSVLSIFSAVETKKEDTTSK